MLSLYPEITGVILAGGKSSRFGKNKAFAQWKGKSFFERIFRVLKSLFSEVLLITNTPEDYIDLPLPVYCDDIPEQGPMGGIYTALLRARTDRVLVVACDLPLINGELIHTLLENYLEYEAVIPVWGDKPQYLMGLYSKSLLPALKISLENKTLAMRDFCHQNPKVRWVPITGDTLMNVNTPEDFKKLEELNA